MLFGESMRESGAGSNDAVVDRHSETHAWIEPALAFGFEQSLANEKRLRAYARLGTLVYLTDPSTNEFPDLSGAPAGVESMRLESGLDRVHFPGEVGVELAAKRFTLGLSYATQRSDIRDRGTGTVRVAIPID